MPKFRTTFTNISVGLGLIAASINIAHAKDNVVYFSLEKAVEAATASGKLDGSVKFYLAGTGPKGQVLQANAVTNKKTNAVGKSDEKACVWVAQSALIQLQKAAKDAGANAVTNIVSYFRKHEYQSTTNFECHVGNIMAGVALKGDLARVEN